MKQLNRANASQKMRGSDPKFEKFNASCIVLNTSSRTQFYY